MLLARKRFWFVVMIAVLGFLVGRFSGGGPAANGPGASAAGEEAAIWTCPMHPQIKLPEPVPCPICGMELVELKSAPASGEREFSMSAADARLLEIEVTPVERQFVNKEIRMVGKVDFDETRVRTVASRIPGENRLERMYVDYTGVPVRTGDHLVILYSPALLTAQAELLESKKRLRADREQSEFLTASDQRAYESVRDKLRLWGLTASQVDEIERRGTAEDDITINSPVSGIVTEKAVNEGDYVDVGEKIYEIADLSRLWIRLEAYERDLAWLHYSQKITIYAEAYPGESFQGSIAFIDPLVDDSRRTINVRVNVDNQDGRLKPGMFVRGLVSARIGKDGRVSDTSLAGKWISPMHPEIVKDSPGECDVCGMDLVPAEELGFVRETAAEAPLVIPASAPLITGTRAVVYVQLPERTVPTYQGREIVLGPRATDKYIVRRGLEEGELVVVNGAFKIDSALQIEAKPSMLSMQRQSFSDESAQLLRKSIDPLIQAYLTLQEALAADELQKTSGPIEQLAKAMQAVSSEELRGAALKKWDAAKPDLETAIKAARQATALESLRAAFHSLSEAVLELEQAVGHGGSEPWFEVFCPMAFEATGAAWLQRGEEIRNPYFGASMLQCGVVRAEYPGAGSATKTAPQPHDHDGGAHR